MVKDIHGPALTLVLEKLKPHGAYQGAFFGNIAHLYSSLLLVVDAYCGMPLIFISFLPPTMFFVFRVI